MEQIKSNVLKGVFYNMDRIIRKNVVKLDKRLSDRIQAYNNIPMAIFKFSIDVAKELFGGDSEALQKQYKKLMKEYALLLQRLTGLGTIGHIHEYDYKNLLASFINKNMRYNPETGENNLMEISGQIIAEINVLLEKSAAAFFIAVKEEAEKSHLPVSFFEEDEKVKKIRKQIVAAEVRNLLVYSVMTVLQGIALKRIEFGKEVSKKIKRAYQYTSSINQFESIRNMRPPLVGGILFRGENYIFEDNRNMDPVKMMNMLNSEWDFSKSSGSWTWNLGVACNFSEISPDNLREKNGYERFFDILKNGKPGNYFVYIDKRDDIIRILKALTAAHMIKSTVVHLVWSCPIVNELSEHMYKEPMQLLVYIGAHGGREEKEVKFIPRKFKVTDNGVDAVIQFNKEELATT